MSFIFKKICICVLTATLSKQNEVLFFFFLSESFCVFCLAAFDTTTNRNIIVFFFLNEKRLSL